MKFKFFQFGEADDPLKDERGNLYIEIYFTPDDNKLGYAFKKELDKIYLYEYQVVDRKQHQTDINSLKGPQQMVHRPADLFIEEDQRIVLHQLSKCQAADLRERQPFPVLFIEPEIEVFQFLQFLEDNLLAP